MDSAIQEIKQKIDIVDFINSYVTLKKAGRNYKANCPFHDEKTPSFVVSPDRQLWRCFGACQEGGDAIAFLMKWDNLTFMEALKELAKKTGVKLDFDNIEDREWKKKDSIIKLNETAKKYYHYLLTDHDSGHKAREYVENRGLNDKLIKTFQLGYAPKTWDSLKSFMVKKGYSLEDLETAGLIIKSKKGTYYDRFRGRLMFPIINKRDQVLGFSGRLLHNDEKQAKYVNTPETPLYHKRQTLYGMHAAHEAIRKNDAAILVEGEFDMISSFKHGISNTVAIKGSAVTKDQLQKLKRLTKNLILALDADFSGTSTALRAIQDAEKMDFRIDVIQYDFGKDPDEALEKDPQKYKKLLKKPTHVYDFIIDTAMKQHNVSDPYGKDEFMKQVLPFIRTISNPIIKNHYVRRIAGITDTDEKSVDMMIKKMTYKDRRKRTNVPKRSKSKTDRVEKLQKYILARMLQSEEPLKHAQEMSDVLSKEDFTVPSYSEIFERFDAYIQKTPKKEREDFDLRAFIENFDDPLQAVLDELFLLDVSAADTSHSDKAYKRTLLELKQLRLKSTIKSGAQNDIEPEEIQKLTSELAQVEKQLQIM